jgi:hypothetical protein
MALFRREAMQGHGALDGAVSLVVPLSWQIVGGLLFAAVAGAVLFLMLAKTDRTLALETVTDRNGRVVAILPQSDAAMLRPGACGIVAFVGGALSTPACITALVGPAPHTLSSGEVVIGTAAKLRLATPAPAGARGTTRFVIGRESLWASIAR